MRPVDEVDRLMERATNAFEHRTVVSRAYYVSFRTLVCITAPLGFMQTPTEADRSKSVHRRLFEFLRTSSQPVLQRIGRNRIESSYRLRIRADYRFETPLKRSEVTEAVMIAHDMHDWLDEAGLSL